MKFNNYNNYGKRGIKVCDDWEDYTKFKAWAESHGYTEERSIDRIDPNKGYYPDNCRWTTMKVQARNKRNNRMETVNNQTKSLTEWCEIYKKDYDLVWMRLKRGWPVERALSTPKLR